MKLTFLGAAHEVTGSCYLLETNGKHILIDCGMEQGPDYYENQEIPIAPGEIDCVFLTHAHIDHSGKLPLIYKNGFQGEIYATDATTDLCNIMLQDSAHIQEFEAEWRNRKAQRAGNPPIEPMYTMEDALGTIQLFVPCHYNTEVNICEGVRIRFTDAGHLLGSSSIEIWVTENGQTKKLVFSGDVGNTHQPIIKDPEYLSEADYVVMESTYGDRSHGPKPDYIASLTSIMEETFARGGNLVIPSFAVGRTQEMLYFLRQIKEEKRMKNHGDFTVYVDSPLAVEATNIFSKNSPCYDAETMALINKGINPISFPGLKTSVTADDSKAINFDQNPKVILSASGMCDAGRIKHHLKHNLWRPECTVLFVGYQAHGTLGRAIIEGAETVKLFGETIEVKAHIEKLEGISGHADNEGLMTWAKHFTTLPKRFFITHGEDVPCETMAGRLRDELKATATAPYNGEAWDLLTDVCVQEGNKVHIKKPDGTPTAAAMNAAQRTLSEAGSRITALLQRSKTGANKDMIKLARQINDLVDKWQNW